MQNLVAQWGAYGVSSPIHTLCHDKPRQHSLCCAFDNSSCHYTLLLESVLTGNETMSETHLGGPEDRRLREWSGPLPHMASRKTPKVQSQSTCLRTGLARIRKIMHLATYKISKQSPEVLGKTRHELSNEPKL